MTSTARPATGPSFAKASEGKRPPLWLVIATATMAVVLLAMSVGETSLSGQYLIDEGEYLSLVGLVFILAAGLSLHRLGRLRASLPLVFPWLLYPVITQGDQIIDHLSITWMRVVVHVLLVAIFAMPVAVIVYAARWMWGLSRRSSRHLTLALLAIEIFLAYQFLGALMIGALIVMMALVWFLGFRDRAMDDRIIARRETVALWMLIGGVLVSGGLYLGFKNRPGAYQGSPSFYMDPARSENGYVSTVMVPSGPVVLPDGNELRVALMAYGASLEKLLEGYHLLDRNYNYHFHNELFIRSTPLVPNYRIAGLGLIQDAARMRAAGDVAAGHVTLGPENPLEAFLQDVRAYVAYSFDRAAILERLSAEFQTTKAGLQHATHIYEGEGKYLGVQLGGLLEKHGALLTADEGRAAVGEFANTARAIEAKYANRIVGF